MSEGASASAAPVWHAAQDINATAVIEKPLGPSEEKRSFMDYLTRSTRSSGSPSAKPSSSANSVEPVITLRDFAGYISLLKRARREAGLPEDEAEAAAAIAGLAATGEEALTASRWRGSVGITTFAPAGDAFSVVPPFFFEPGFRLSDPATMREVFQPGAGLDALQDGLTVLLDTVECQLLSTIKARSRQFFEALSSLTELRDRVLDGNIAATALRRQLERVRDEACLQPLSVLILHRRRCRAAAARELMVRVSRAMAAPAAVSAMYNSGDWMGALDTIRQVLELIRAHLTGVLAVAPIRRRLEEFAKLIANEIGERFSREALAVTMLGGDAEGTAEATLTGGASAFSVEAALVARIRPLVAGLTRTRKLGQALERLQATLVAEIREFVRSDVDEAVYAELLGGSGGFEAPAGAAAGGSAAGTVTAEKIQGLAPSAFLRVFSSVSSRALELCARLHSLHDFLERSLDALQGKAAVPLGESSGRDAVEWESDVSAWRAQSAALVAVGVDATSRNLSRLLGLRRDASSRLKLGELKALWDCAASFSVTAQVLMTQSLVAAPAAGGRADGGVAAADGPPSSSSSLVAIEVLAHARAWLSRARERNVASLAALLDAETWKQADVPAQVQAVAAAIEASITAGAGGGRGSGAAGAVQIAAASAASPSSPSAVSADGSVTYPTLSVAGHAFPVVASGVMLVKMLGDYAGAAEALPDLAADAIGATAELLREFNARATSLVLGAGAIATAALKKITAKHLAMTLQTVGALLALLPAVRALLLMRLPHTQHTLLADLASVTADILSHENRLRAKFVAIVKDLLVKCCTDMRGLAWGGAAPVPCPSAPMLELARGVSTLHRILGAALRPEQLEDVTSRVLVMVNAYLPGQVQAIVSHAVTAAGEGSFSRDIMSTRLGGDVAMLLRELDVLLPPLQVEDAGASGAESPPASYPSAPGRDALLALRRWAETAFGGVGSPVLRAGDGEEAATVDLSGEAEDIEGGHATEGEGASPSEQQTVEPSVT